MDLDADATRPRPWPLTAIAFVGCMLLGLFALREYKEGGAYLAAPDYLVEILPAINALKDEGIRGYIDNLPGYPGAAMLEYIPAQLAVWLGLGEATTWRLLSAIGIAATGVAIVATMRLARGSEAGRTAITLAVLIAAASPAAYWALRIGHPEELLSTGLLLGAVAAAVRERPILAGVLLGLAVGKAWPAVAALPVLGLLLPDPRRVTKGVAAAAASAGVIFVPALLMAGDKVRAMTDLGQSGIFNVGQVFWWFGDPVARSLVDCTNGAPGCQSVPQPRGQGPVWSGELSHPLVLGVGVAIGLVWAWTLHTRLTRAGQVSVLRTDGRTRSDGERAQLAAAALLVMAGILYARCFLDTWNVPYYILPALVLGAMGEALTGRIPIISLLASAIMWKWHAPGDLTVRTDPDVYTAFYLAWTIPFGIALTAWGLRLASGVVTGPDSGWGPAAAAAAAGDAGPGASAVPAGSPSGAATAGSARPGSSAGERTAAGDELGERRGGHALE